MKITKELVEIFTARLEEARIKFGSKCFEEVPEDVRDILIAGEMLDQANNEIERLNPHKESFNGELSPAIENMIHDIGMEVDDMKHIILAAQAETKEQMCKASDLATGRFEKEIAGWEPTK
ncbi:hypothetical protein [Vibrio rotiferianus]|uniref:hypothetical protein n=1 Tax=Vibrio rotiferianus TaxID=190895 RepID=UPI0015F69823|nr:hypothetical protein [Vibrio rotiferianus]